MTEALLHRAGRFPGNGERLASARITTSVFRIAHTFFIPRFLPMCAHALRLCFPLPILIREPVQFGSCSKSGQPLIGQLYRLRKWTLADETVYHTLTSKRHAQFF